MAKGELVVEHNQEVQLPTIVAQQNQYMSLIQLAVEKGADIVQLEKLMDLQERYEANQARKDFAAAISKFQSMLPVIEKNGVVDYTSAKGRTYYNYAKLEDIAHAIKPALKETGLSYRFTQRQHQDWITVICIVTHSNGHSEISELTSQPDISGGKDPLKAIASAISYLRRYTLTGSLGIVVGGEDDDAGAAGSDHLVDGEQTPTENQGFYPDESFNSVFPKWEKLILEGKKTPDQIISNGNKKGITFGPDQLQKINNVGKA